MNEPKEFKIAVRLGRDFSLSLQEGTPVLSDASRNNAWVLDGFTCRAAFCFADNELEGHGYKLVSMEPPTWKAPSKKDPDTSHFQKSLRANICVLSDTD